MKPMTFLGVIALIMLLALPGAVMAADVTVSGSILPDAPTAAFSASPTIGAQTLSVFFTDASTPADNIDEWIWEYRVTGTDTWIAFDESTEQDPTQDFDAGYYDIRLTVTNAAGSDEEIKLKYIKVSPGPLLVTNKQSGTVSGDMYFSAVQPTPMPSQPQNTGVTQEAEFAFAPSGYTTIEYARLYTMVYVAGTDTRECVASVSFDGNNDGTYETVLENAVTLNTESMTNGNVWWQGDHINRVYSDYVMFYDVKDYITTGTVKAKVQTTPGASNMDGRIKYLALVVAYNDGDTDQVKYWINDGHHWNNVWTSPVGTDYDTSALTTGIVDAQLRMVHTSSADSSYTFNTVSKPGQSPPTGVFFMVNTWDIKNELPATLSELRWSKTSGSHKVTMAMLKTKYIGPTAAFSGTPLTGDRPLTVAFTDASTGSVTGWAWDFDNDGNVDSTAQNPSYQYTTAGYKTVKLTVTGPLGSDDEVKTDYIYVKEPAPIIDFSADDTTPLVGQTVTFTATNTGGQVDSWLWNFGDGQTSTDQNPTHQYTSEGTFTVSLTATGPDYSDTETKTNYIQVGAAIIDVTVSPASIDFGSMQAGVDETGSTTVNVDVTEGTAWSVTASASNGGYMGTGSVNLANPFQLSNDGTNFQAMTSNFANFMTGAAGVDGSDTADVKQTIAAADAPGAYSITLAFTGGFS